MRGRIVGYGYGITPQSVRQRYTWAKNSVFSSAYGGDLSMARVMLTGRVTDAQAAALKSYAADVGLPVYQATVRALELGIAILVGGRGAEPAQAAPASVSAGEIDALREAIDRLSQRAELSDRLTQRTLYAAGAAYAAALAGPGESAEHKAQITRDADQIFDRQLARARQEPGEKQGG
jgi:hypothetical protein